MSMTTPIPTTRRDPSPDRVRIVLVSGQRGPYDMFDVLDAAGGPDGKVRVRGSLLLEIGEELDLRVERGAESATVRGRVVGHETRGSEAVTTFALVGDTAPADRLLGA
jgi:hypothetical protein